MAQRRKTSPMIHLDVTGDGSLTPLDALTIIRELNQGTRVLPRYIAEPDLRSDGTLQICGTIDNDIVHIYETPGELVLDVSAGDESREHRFPIDGVARIEFTLVAGDDTHELLQLRVTTCQTVGQGSQRVYLA
jgi:hypothetical protein